MKDKEQGIGCGSMPREQQEFLNKLSSYMLDTTNMTKTEAWDFAFRCWQFSDSEKFRALVFDNKPYEFEELGVGMWVWDDIDKLYALIIELIVQENDANVLVLKYCRSPYEYINYDTEYIRFEENRFYPREVKDYE